MRKPLAPGRRGAAAALVASVLWAPLALLVAAEATAEAAYSSVVSAQNLHVTITNAAGSFPIVPQVDFGLGTAQAALDNNGGSSAYASSPDPGFIGTLPALAGSIIPVPLPVALPSVAYPATATTSNGQPPVTIGTAAYQLHAEANDDEALASSIVGGTTDGSSGAATATARGSIAHREDGTVTASAVSDTSALTVLGLVTVGQVHAEAKVIRDPGGGITRSSDLAIGRLSVAGLTVAYANGKFTALGTDLPVDLALLNGLLHTASQGKVSLSETARQDTPNGLVSSALEITQIVPAPPGDCVRLPLPLPILGGVTYCGETKIVYTLGGAIAGTSYQAFDLDPGDTDTGTEPGGVTPDTGGSAPLPGLPVTDPPILDSPPVLAPAGNAGVDTPTPSVAGKPELRLSGFIPRPRGAAHIYLALAAAGLLALGAITAVRLLGVRNTWAA